jgi:DNA-binding FadR family transcriptional regulator
VVSVARGRGIYVADLADTDVFRQLAAWIDTSELDNDEYVKVRSIFERGIFELVIENASDADMDRIRAIAQSLQDAPTHEEIQRLHDEFHQACLDATGNRFLKTLGTILYRFFWSVTAAGPRVRQVSPPELQSSHVELAELLRRRRPSDVGAMVAIHLGISGD